MNPSAADGLTEKISDELGYRDSALDGTRQRLVEAADLAGPAYRDFQIVIPHWIQAGEGEEVIRVRG